MQFKSTVAVFALTFLAANGSPTPQLGDLGSTVSGLLGDVTGAVSGLVSAIGSLPSSLAGSSPAGGSTGGTTASGGGSTATGGGNGSTQASCPESSEQYCCNPTTEAGALLSLDCVVQSVMGIGSTCDKEAVCCANNGGTQLCTSSNGAAVNVPLTLGGLNLNL